MRPTSKYYGDINKPFANGATNICITFAVIFAILWGICWFINDFFPDYVEKREKEKSMGAFLSYDGYTYTKISYVGISNKTPKDFKEAKVHQFLVTELRTREGVAYDKAYTYLEIKRDPPNDRRSFYGVEAF